MSFFRKNSLSRSNSVLELPSLTTTFKNQSTSMFDQRKSLDLQLQDLLERTEKFTQRANQFTGAASYVKSGFSRLTSTIDRFRDNVSSSTFDSRKTLRRKSLHLETIEDSFDEDDSTEIQWRKIVDDNRLIYEAIQLLKWRVRYPKPTFYEYSPSEGSPYTTNCSFHQSFQSPVCHTPTDEVAQRIQMHLERTHCMSDFSLEVNMKKVCDGLRTDNETDDSRQEDVVSPGASKRTRFEEEEKKQNVKDRSKEVDTHLLQKKCCAIFGKLGKENDPFLAEESESVENNDASNSYYHGAKENPLNTDTEKKEKTNIICNHERSDIVNDTNKKESSIPSNIEPLENILGEEMSKITSTCDKFERERSLNDESPLEKQAEGDLHFFQRRYSLKAAKFDESDVEVRLINRVPLKERLALRRSQMQRTNTRVEDGNFVYRFYK